jgi:hypothetical protein
VDEVDVHRIVVERVEEVAMHEIAIGFVNALALEREPIFRDRVRGEGLHAWGVAEARALGIADALLATCGHEVRYWARARGGEPAQRRDLIASTDHHAGELTFFHPEMQTEVLRLAVAAGAEVRRGVVVGNVQPGPMPAIAIRADGGEAELTA